MRAVPSKRYPGSKEKVKVSPTPELQALPDAVGPRAPRRVPGHTLEGEAREPGSETEEGTQTKNAREKGRERGGQRQRHRICRDPRKARRGERELERDRGRENRQVVLWAV